MGELSLYGYSMGRNGRTTEVGSTQIYLGSNGADLGAEYMWEGPNYIGPLGPKVGRNGRTEACWYSLGKKWAH